MNTIKTLVLSLVVVTLLSTSTLMAQGDEEKVSIFGIDADTVISTCGGVGGMLYVAGKNKTAKGFKGKGIKSLRSGINSTTATPPKPIEWEDVDCDTTGSYLNNVCEITYEVDGETKYDSYGSATADKLIDSLQKIRHAAGKVSNIEIKGHGAPECQQMGGDTMLIATGSGFVLATMKDGQSVDITNLLKSTCKPDVHIQLNGCKTGRGEDNVAQNLSGALPGSTVAGGSHYQLSIPFTSNSFGTKNYYRHGQKVEKDWYCID